MNKTSAGTFDENIFKILLVWILISRATFLDIERNYRINKIPFVEFDFVIAD